MLNEPDIHAGPPGAADLNYANATLGQLGDLVVRIAATPGEIGEAQALRHRIFNQENDDTLSASVQPADRRDEDRFDRYCDHLIVEDISRGRQAGRIVATYRLLSSQMAQKAGGFYSQSEFDVAALLAKHADKRFLEFGRSCVLPDYRSKRTIELLWHGSWAYVRKNGFDVMFGCASFPGTDIREHADGLAFLRQQAAPTRDWSVAARGEIAEISRATSGEVDLKRGLRALPPLIKGYLRLGAMFAEDAVVDRAFNTTDVLVLLPLERLNPRYVKYYGADAERHRS